MKVNPRTPIHGMLPDELAARCESLGLPAFRARQVWNWLYVKNAADWKAMKNLPAALQANLAEQLTLDPSDIFRASGIPGKTRKLLLRLADGEHVEAVIIPAGRRLTTCLSSQVGCRWHCAFCASGQNGYTRNLETHEMVSQLLLAWRESGTKPTHVVFMGVGEPMDNYDHLLKTVRILNHSDGLNIAARRITISTSGIIPGIVKLAGEGLQVELSVSLHAPNDAIRTRLMPVNRKYPVTKLLDACRQYATRTKRLVTFEYTLIKDINDSPSCARELARRLSTLPARVNLIPLSPVTEFQGTPSPGENTDIFLRILEDQGINVTLRASRGGNIHAACGQLRAGVSRF